MEKSHAQMKAIKAKSKKEPASHAEKANDKYWMRKNKLYGTKDYEKIGFTPRDKKEEKLFNKAFRSKTA